MMTTISRSSKHAFGVVSLLILLSGDSIADGLIVNGKNVDGNQIINNEYVVNLLKSRNEHAIINMIKYGSLSHDSVLVERFSLLHIAAYTKLSDLFSFLIRQNDLSPDPQLLSFIFSKDTYYPEESMNIIREYIDVKYEDEHKLLDLHDGIFLITRLCQGTSFVVADISKILEGVRVSVSADLHRRATELKNDRAGGSHKDAECLRYLLSIVESY